MSKQTKNDILFQTLQALCKKAIDKVILYKEQSKLEVSTYQHLPVKDIDYLMETYNYDWDKLNYFDFYEWRSKDFVSFIETELYSLIEFEEAAKQIMEEFKVPEYAVKRIGLFSLLRLIMKQTPNGQITYENIDDYVQLFIDDYESYRSNIPTNWEIDLWLKSIYIESDEIEIATNVFLRQPTKEQLAEVKLKPNHISEFDRMTGRELIAGAILSFTVPARKKRVSSLYPDEVITQIEKWLNIFRLLKPTDITVVYQSVAPISIFENSISENKNKPQDNFWRGKIENKDTSSFKLHLKKDEEKILKVFIKNLNSALKGFSNTSYLTGNYYDLAFHRYNDSLLKTEVNAYKILSAITSLEALLSDGGTEITFKIRLRVAKLLSHFGLDALYVSDKMKDAYNLRSKLVHGSKLKDKKKDLLEFARQHTHEILNFNRICLLVALQLKQKKDKQNLIKLIDNSFIDKSYDENLKKLINENVKIPIINPYYEVEQKTEKI